MNYYGFSSQDMFGISIQIKKMLHIQHFVIMFET